MLLLLLQLVSLGCAALLALPQIYWPGRNGLEFPVLSMNAGVWLVVYSIASMLSSPFRTTAYLVFDYSLRLSLAHVAFFSHGVDTKKWLNLFSVVCLTAAVALFFGSVLYEIVFLVVLSFAVLASTVIAAAPSRETVTFMFLEALLLLSMSLYLFGGVWHTLTLIVVCLLQAAVFVSNFELFKETDSHPQRIR